VCVSYEGKFDVARKIKVDGAKGGGQKPDGNKGKGKNATTEAGGIYAASVLSGDGFYLDGDKITAGTIGIGEVTIDSGVYTIDKLYSGRAYDTYAPTYGTVTITGGSTYVTVDEGTPGSTGSIDVGYDNPGGTGYLNILAGATVTSNNQGYWDGYDVVGGYNNVRIGFGAGSFGRVTVDGIGSKLLTYGASPRIQIGRDYGTGELVISGGGYALTLNVEVGRDDGIGRLTIDGEGSELRVNDNAGTNADPQYTGEGGFVNIGRTGGRGYLYVTNGGTLTVNNTDGVTDFAFMRFARENGTYGYGLVSGTGSSINVIQYGPAGDSYDGGALLLLGDGGQGILKVTDDAQVNVTGDRARLSVADGRYTDGVPDNTAAQSQLIIQSGADVLVDSQGYGGYGNGASMVIGNRRETNGAVTVDGLGSTLTVTTTSDAPGDYQSALITVGRLGYGRLDVTDYGAVSARGMYVGSETDGPYSGYGIVNINTGGTVTVTGTDYTPYRGVRIARSPGTTGIVNVDGAGSTLTSEGGVGYIRVASFGTGELNITDGGRVNAFTINVGRNYGSDGRVTVDGAGRDLSFPTPMVVSRAPAEPFSGWRPTCTLAPKTAATAISASPVAHRSTSSTTLPTAMTRRSSRSAAKTGRGASWSSTGWVPRSISCRPAPWATILAPLVRMPKLVLVVTASSTCATMRRSTCLVRARAFPWRTGAAVTTPPTRTCSRSPAAPMCSSTRRAMAGSCRCQTAKADSSMPLPAHAWSWAMKHRPTGASWSKAPARRFWSQARRRRRRVSLPPR